MTMALLTAAATAMTALQAQYAAKIGQINASVAAALVQFDAWRADRDVLGQNGATLNGSRRMAMFQGLLQFPHQVGSKTLGFANINQVASNSNVRIHFKTPLTNLVDGQYRFDFQGYNYGASELVDARCAFWSIGGTLFALAVSGTHSPHVYKGSDGFIYLRLSFTALSYLTLAVDCQATVHGLAPIGFLVPTLSLSPVETL